MPDLSAQEQLAFARAHLRRVQAAWIDPVDWADLGNYGLYALEAAVMAAARASGLAVRAAHWDKVRAADELAARGLPSVSGLMRDLNEARKAANYGDVEAPALDPEDVARRIEEYVEAVGRLVSGGKE